MATVLTDQSADFIRHWHGFRWLLQEVIGFEIITSAVKSTLVLVINQPDDGVLIIPRLERCRYFYMLSMRITNREL